jgi:hypothetical protein
LKATASIIFIAGYGRSGSTLLDIVLGNAPGHFSVGELLNLPVNGIIDNEYCACGERVMSCPFWSGIIAEWNEVRVLPLTEYITVQQRFLRNKKTMQSVWNYFFPGAAYNAFVQDTKALYNLLLSKTDIQVIIDSSKIPQRLLLLRKTGLPVKVVHLYRNFSGVMYATSKELQKDPKAGVEKVIEPQSMRYVTLTWLWCNLLTKLFSIGMDKLSVEYAALIQNPIAAIGPLLKNDIEYNRILEQKGPFVPGHLVAGGRVRMKKEIFIQSNLLAEEQSQATGFKGWLIRRMDKIKW